MEFQQTRDFVSGTSLVGYVDGRIPYETMVEIFGEDNGAGDKTLAEWDIKFRNGVVAHIYDWKNFGMSKEDIDTWHIGGMDKLAAQLVNEVIVDWMRKNSRPVVGSWWVALSTVVRAGVAQT